MSATLSAGPRERELRYGPFEGHAAALPKEETPRMYAAPDSYNYAYQPRQKKFVRRSGSARVFDAGNAGLLPTKWGARMRQILDFRSPSFADGQPSVLALLTKEALADANNVDDGRFGVVYVRDVGNAVNYVLGSEFGATHYPLTNGVKQHFKMIPLWYDSGTDGGLTRGAFEFARRFLAPGARRMLKVGSRWYSPNYLGTPWGWTGAFNPSSASGTESLRLGPSGPLPTLWPPTVTKGTDLGAAPAYGPWKGSDKFATSCVLIDPETGAWYMPFIPRDIQSGGTLPNGLGIVTVDAANPTHYFDKITYTNLPKRPYGFWLGLLRSKKIDSSAAGALKLGELGLVAVITDNSVTSYVDTGGDDGTLVLDANKLFLRWDYQMPPCARYIFPGDQRVFHAYGRTNPSALFVAPVGVNSDYDLNIDDDQVLGSVKTCVHNDGTNFRLKKDVGGVTTAYVMALATYDTLQKLVDKINTTSFAVDGQQWRAAIAPGADPNAPTAQLLRNSQAINSKGAIGNAYIDASVAGTFSALAVGMKVRGSASIPANAVIQKISTTSRVYLCDESGTAVVLTGNIADPTSLTFYFDLGDDALMHDSSYGNMQIVCAALMAPVYFRKTYFDDKRWIDKDVVWMTLGGPNQAKASANSWVTAIANKHRPPGTPGIAMGGGEVGGGIALLYSSGIYGLQNQKGGKSGLDEDYRVVALNERRGAITWDVDIGSGWLPYATSEGIFACDIEREIQLSGWLWDTGPQRGELAYEIGQCLAAIAADSDAAHLHVKVAHDAVQLTYRSAAASYPDRRCVYDFSAGESASGLAQLLQADGTTWGWGTPFKQNLSVLAEVHRDGVRHFYGAVENNGGSTGDGRIDEFDTGSQDNGAAVDAKLYLRMDPCDTLDLKAGQEVTVVHRNVNSGCSLLMSRDVLRATQVSLPLSQSADPVQRELVALPQASRCLGDFLELVYVDDGSGATPSELRAMALKFLQVTAYQ